MTMTTMPGPLAGVKVVELGIWVAAPAAAAIMADWGADVIKIESPDGDPMRAQASLTLPHAKANPFFDPDNRGKRSLTLNLREEADRDRLLALLDTADVFVSNVRTAGLRRLGITPEIAHARNPRLIYAMVNAYGFEGPDADVGGFDLGAYWARSGIAYLLTPPDGSPPIQRMAMGDHQAAMTIAGMVSAALFQRESTQKGQVVSTSLLRVAAYQIAADLNAKLMIDKEPELSDRRDIPNPLWNNYVASDGGRFWLMSPEPDRNWPKLARIVGRPDWAENPQYKTRIGRAPDSPLLIAELDKIFASEPFEKWAAAFDAESDFFWSPIRTAAEALADPQTAAAGAFAEVDTPVGILREIASPADFHDTPRAVIRAAPKAGADTASIVDALDREPGNWPERSDAAPPA